MTDYLSDAWLADPFDPGAEALAAAGGSMRLRRVITGTPDGEASFECAIGSGAVTYGPPGDDEADVTLRDTHAHALAMVRGELDPNAAFMRGQTKVAGSTGKILELMAATKTEPYEAARARLAGSLEG